MSWVLMRRFIAFALVPLNSTVRSQPRVKTAPDRPRSRQVMYWGCTYGTVGAPARSRAALWPANRPCWRACWQDCAVPGQWFSGHLLAPSDGLDQYPSSAARKLSVNFH